ncbi:pyroglutamyl-peptidase 1 [Chanos chanos]|uniref:Pyroglutamyl-peptidase 1 n=1 Tax=Chanos chanos TaxID=29144 RepID=A0A6J2UM95_CHACN|nr:pyroglutamyl-peptidase 1-like [Chanos chanos]
MGSGDEVVVITGFGPFRQYLVNPSWEAAKGLKIIGLGDGLKVHIQEVPVSYSKAMEAITNIWQTVKPKVAVHLGIAPGSRCITLEQRGKNQGYKGRDVCGLCPANHCCIVGGPDTLDSIIDMKSLTKHLKSLDLDVIYSRDAGRYLCDFTYYCSLYHGQGRAAFIHVPASGSLACPARLVPLLHSIIQAMLCQLDTPKQTAPTASADYKQTHAEQVQKSFSQSQAAHKDNHLQGGAQ